jgi:hypothetical protein
MHQKQNGNEPLPKRKKPQNSPSTNPKWAASKKNRRLSGFPLKDKARYPYRKKGTKSTAEVSVSKGKTT